MQNQALKDYLLSHVLPRVQMPAQYLGGELNMVRKDHREGRGKLCMCFPGHLHDRHEPSWLAGPLFADEPEGRLALRAGLHAAAGHGGRIAAAPICPCTAWRISRRCASSMWSASRCSTKSAPATC